MKKKLETKRIWIFLAFAFGIAWSIDLAIYLLGGLSELRLGSLRGFLLLGSMYALLGIDPDGPLPNPRGLDVTVMPASREGKGRLTEIM